MAQHTEEPLVHEATEAEGWAILEKQAQKRLHLTAKEFVHKWETGAFQNCKENSEAIRVAMFLPFVQ